jgi:hypothetical protein
VNAPTILEVKETLTGERREFPCTLLAVAQDEVVLLYRLPYETSVADLFLPAGTLSLGYFWTMRPYNAYHWLTTDGHTLGLYFNISDRPHLTSQRMVWRDLVVDVLVTPDGRCRVLDEDEVPVDVDPSLRLRIEAARDELLRQHKALLAEVEARSGELLRAAGMLDEGGAFT